jgi:uncharacterized protein YndB with AHSA1/START domain
MTMTADTTPQGAARRTTTTFRMEYAVALNIRATPQRLWALLTDAADFPRWNSSVLQIDGKIAEGETIRLSARVAPERTFKLAVRDVVPGKSMVWSDGMAPMFKGVRTYTLTAKPDGTTDFSMVEVFSGLMLPMIASSLPDFRESFERYAADLKREAERSQPN